MTYRRASRGAASRWSFSSGVLSPVAGVSRVEVPDGGSTSPGVSGSGADTGWTFVAGEIHGILNGSQEYVLKTNDFQVPPLISLGGGNERIRQNGASVRVESNATLVASFDVTAISAEGDTSFSTVRYHDGTSQVTGAVTAGAADSESAGFRALRIPN